MFFALSREVAMVTFSALILLSAFFGIRYAVITAWRVFGSGNTVPVPTRN